MKTTTEKYKEILQYLTSTTLAAIVADLEGHEADIEQNYELAPKRFAQLAQHALRSEREPNGIELDEEQEADLRARFAAYRAKR